MSVDSAQVGRGELAGDSGKGKGWEWEEGRPLPSHKHGYEPLTGLYCSLLLTLGCSDTFRVLFRIISKVSCKLFFEILFKIATTNMVFLSCFPESLGKTEFV